MMNNANQIYDPEFNGLTSDTEMSMRLSVLCYSRRIVLKNKLLLIILIFSLVSCVPRGTPDLDYRLIDSGTAYEVARGPSVATKIIIPSRYKGLPVTKIADNGFHDRALIRVMQNERETMTSISLPNSITTIGSGAFIQCEDLTSIILPNSLTTISSGAFLGCTGLTSLVIPNSVTHIGNNAFYDCTSLTSVCIPNSVTYIGDQAFAGSTSLTDLYINTTVVDSWFSGNTSLKNITIGNSVTTIGLNAFADCIGLTSIDIPKNVTSIGESAFSRCISFTTLVIPNSVTHIGDSAFYGCTNLASVYIPNSVTHIGARVFAKIPVTWCSDSIASMGSFQMLTIYAEVLSQPDGWDMDWNSDNSLVVWNATMP